MGIWMQKTVALKKIPIPADMNTQSYLTSNKDLLVDYNDIQFNELLGRGNFGSVYKGIWMQKTVALKKISIPADMNTVLFDKQQGNCCIKVRDDVNNL